jgi:uroporphyrinogen decarboxylase
LAAMMARDYATTGVDGVGVDTGSDIAVVASMLPAHMAVQGNLDPLAVVAGGPAMAGEVAPILDVMRGRPFIFNLGHGIVPQTPLEHVAALLELVRGA